MSQMDYKFIKPLPAGIPDDSAITAGDTLETVLYKLQGQLNYDRPEILTLVRNTQDPLIIDMLSDNYVMTQEESQRNVIVIQNSGDGTKNLTLFASNKNPALYTLFVYSGDGCNIITDTDTHFLEPILPYNFIYKFGNFAALIKYAIYDIPVTPATAVKVTYNKFGVITGSQAAVPSDVGLGNVPNVDATNASNISSGIINIDRLPAAALERLVTVADQAARFALTTATVQTGDTVKQLDSTPLYLVVDDTNLNNASGYVEYTANTSWGSISNIPTPVQNLTGTNSGDETSQRIGTLISNSTEKTTPVDADMFGLMDSAAGNLLKKLSWANVKATMKTYMDTLYLPLPSSNGIAVRTTSTTAVARTITGTANLLDVTNGDGVSDNPTLAVNLTSYTFTSDTDYSITSTSNVAIDASVRLTGLPAGKYFVICTCQITNSANSVDAFLGLHSGTEGATTLITASEIPGRYTQQAGISSTYTYELPVTVSGVTTLTSGQIIEPKIRSGSGSITIYNTRMTAVRIG